MVKHRARRLIRTRWVLASALLAGLTTSGLALAGGVTTNVHLGATSYGTYTASRLQNGHHDVLYMFTHDQRDHSRCVGQCARDYPPFILRGKLRAWNGVRFKLLGTISRGHGVRQVTYNHHPLYLASMDDPGTGTSSADGCAQDGGTWFVLDRNGRPDTRYRWPCGGY